MKKLLTYLATLSVTTSTLVTVVACSTPTRSPENVHVLAKIFNEAVNQAIADNPLEKPAAGGAFDTTAILKAVVDNMNNQKDELEKNRIFLKTGLIEKSPEAENGLTSITEFDKLTAEQKTSHQKYLSEQKLNLDDILIYLDSSFIEASKDNPERITIKIPRMTVVTTEKQNVLLNDGNSLKRLGIITIKS